MAKVLRTGNFFSEKEKNRRLDDVGRLDPVFI